MWKKITAIVAAVLLAVVGTGVLVAYVRTAETRALAGEEMVDVLVVTAPVERGTAARDIGDRVRTESVPVKVRPADAVSDLAALGGQVTTVGLVAGEQVLQQRFTDPELLTSVEVPPGLLQVTVALDPERAVGGNVRPGQLVSVVASFTGSSGTEEDGSETPDEVTHLILHKILVTNVQLTSRNTSQASPTGGSDDGGPGAAPTGKVLVTLAVDAPSVERIVFVAEHGSMWLGAEPEDAPEGGTTIQTRETILR